MMRSDSTDMQGDGLRIQNARAAAAYNVLPYEAALDPALDVERVLGVGALYGCNAAPLDVLDLGCGTGLALARAAEQTVGRLTGIDLSEGNCRKARERLSTFGARAEILGADFLDLDADRLGQFDVIYAIGVIYIVPPPVRQHLTRLIGRCLKPGGVVMVSHYSGPLAALRVQLHAIIGAAIDEPDPKAAVLAARALCKELAGRLERNGYQLPLSCLRQTMSLPDTTFYHEIFNPWLAPIPAAELHRDFSEQGIGFLCRTDAGNHGAAAPPATRAFDADVEDLAGGGYRTSLFGRGAGAPDLRAPGLRWITDLTRVPASIDGYVHVSGNRVRVVDPRARALLDALIEGQGGTKPFASNDGMEAELRNLWNARLIAPLSRNTSVRVG